MRERQRASKLIGSSDIDAWASRGLKRDAGTAVVSSFWFSTSAGSAGAQCNMDFGIIGLPSYQHFLPSMSR
jgi:hypothetical protein